MKITLAIVILLNLFSLDASSQDYTRMGLPEGATMRLGKGHIRELRYSPDGSRLAVATPIGIWLYDTTTYQEVALLAEKHRGWVNSVVFSPDGSTLASGSARGAIHLWDARTGAYLRTVTEGGFGKELSSLALSSNGSMLAGGGLPIRLWDMRTGAFMHTLEGHTGRVTSVAFGAGNTLASGGGWDDNTIRLWDARTATHLHTLEGHTDSVTSVAFHPDGSTLASGSQDRTIRLWDARTGATLHTVTLGERTGDVVESLAFSPDGSTLAGASWNDTILLWDARTGAQLRTLDGHTRAVYSVAFSPNGGTLASGSSDSTLRVWDARTGAQLRTLEGYTSHVESLAFSPDGGTLAVASHNDTVRLWDTRTGTHLLTLENYYWADVKSVAFSPDGSILAGGNQGGTVRLWDARTGAVLRTLEGHTDNIQSVAFSPDGNTLASGSWDSTIRLVDARTGAYMHTLEGHTGWVSSVAFSPDGSTLASGGGWEDNTIRLWDARTGERLRTLEGHTDRVYSVAFNPDGSTLASGSQDGTVRLWDARSGAYRRALEEHTGGIKSVVFSPDGGTIASGDWNGTVLLWDIPPAPNTTAIVSLSLAPTLSPAVGARIKVSLTITDGHNVAGYQATLTFDSSALRYLESANGVYLPGDVFTVPPGVTANQITLAATSLAGESQGDGSLATVIFEVIAIKPSILRLSDVALSDRAGAVVTPRLENAEITVTPQIAGDVNQDGTVNIQDLVLVAGRFGQAGQHDADVNGDGVVNIQDLVLVAGALGNAAAPSGRDMAIALTRTEVKAWLAQAERLALTDAISLRGVQFLENLLAALTPKETALLPNYPNPFNPETWIPYRLAHDASVTLTIYDAGGRVVRVLDVGHQPAAFYESRSNAIYWDGRNESGEQVASGLYFYHLAAGDFAATRKMLIQK